jgi:hypothetical protein
MRWQSFHGHPGATMSGPATGVTGGIFLAGLLKRLTHRWTSTPLVPAKNWPCPGARMVRLMERVMEMFRETPEFYWAYVAFPNFPPPEAWWVKAHALRRELETVGEGVLPEMSPGFIPEELLPGKEEK